MADISEGSGIALGLVITLAAAVAGLSGWAAVLRHKIGQHGRRLASHSRRLRALEDDRTARDAVAAAAGTPPPSVPSAAWDSGTDTIVS